MLQKEGFNEWAQFYDDSVKDDEDYPFAGYFDLFDYIIKEMDIKENTSILDVGIGTGVLSSYLNHLGAFITGIDFSSSMLEIAKNRIKIGRFINHDLNEGLPEEIKKSKYQYIVSTYVFHHFTFKQKIDLILELVKLLLPNGKLMIGDVSFLTKGELNACRDKCQPYWDEDEIYIVYEELVEGLKKHGLNYLYHQISFCSGVIVIEKHESLLEQLLNEERKEFKGWDFSYIKDRIVDFPLTWHYENLVKNYLKNSTSLLDMGTGGGEFLSQLEGVPENTCATEGYAPNVKIAKDRLEPLGIKVFAIKDDDNLPFKDQQFDLIINRHEAFSTYELKRILKSQGVFITQQVGGLNDSDINEMLGAESSQYIDWNLEKALRDFNEHDFEILMKKECITKSRCFDIGALVYFLKCIPWQIEDFTIDKYYDGLVKINNIIEEQGYIDFICHRFIIIARRR